MTMVYKAVTVVILLIFVQSVVKGKSEFGKCWKFGPNEEIPTIKGRDWYCLSEDGNKYCFSFACPTTYCNKPLSPASGKCRYCKGTCSYGEKVYRVGDSFECLDGANRCTCGDNNSIGSTLAMPHPTYMCKKIIVFNKR